MIEELKPCECGNIDIDIDETIYFADDIRYKCVCPQCGRETEQYDTEEQAISAWNKRNFI